MRQATTLKQRYGGYALVTGSARGIGRAFAEQLAVAGCDLLLVDVDAAANEALAAQLSATHGVDARAIVDDLTQPGLVARASRWAEDFEIGILINNAGISQLDGFFRIPLDTHLKTLELNSRATLILTHVIGSGMNKRGRGAIVIISSASAITGGPYTAQYAATKAYSLSLASNLWAEMDASGIDVLAVSPGLTHTHIVEDLIGDRRPPYVPISGPEVVAKRALRALGKQPLLVPAWGDRVSTWMMSWLLPRRWALKLVMRVMSKLGGMKELP